MAAVALVAGGYAGSVYGGTLPTNTYVKERLIQGAPLNADAAFANARLRGPVVVASGAAQTAGWAMATAEAAARGRKGWATLFGVFSAFGAIGTVLLVAEERGHFTGQMPPWAA